ncbi:hypothetical protein [Streptomyces chartreusis]
MSLSDAVWGYCFGCNREVEVRMGALIPHGRACIGSGTVPRTPPQEGTWTPPQRRTEAMPEPADTRTEPPSPLVGFFRSLIHRSET